MTRLSFGLALLCFLGVGSLTLNAQAIEVGPYCGKSIVSEVGPGEVWQAAVEAKCDDNDSKAYTAPLANGQFSQTLKVRDFGFNIPNDARIEGIEVVVIRRSDLNGGIVDKHVQLFDAKHGTSKNLATKEVWTSEWTAAYYGSAEETWGMSLSPEDVNATSFGFAFQAVNTGLTTRPEVDEVLVSIHYSLPGNIWFMVRSGKNTAQHHCTAL